MVSLPEDGRRQSRRPWSAALAVALAFTAMAACSGGRDPEPRPAPATTQSTIGNGEPLLGRPVSWSLLVGSAERPDAELERLDLDSGHLTSYHGVAGAPIVAIRGRLVLQQTDPHSGTATLRVVPLSDPTAAPTELDQHPPTGLFPGSALPTMRGEGARLWFYTESDGRALWALVDLEEGVTSERISIGPAGGPAPVAGGGPDVVSSPDPGVYRLDDDGYRLLGPGIGIAISDGAILTRACPERGCTLQWIDEQDGAPVERVLPDSDIRWEGLVPGNDRFLTGEPEAGGDLRIHDVKEGREIELGFASIGGAASSPDGRLVAVQSPAGLELYDIDRSWWVSIPLSITGPATIAFVPSG